MKHRIRPKTSARLLHILLGSVAVFALASFLSVLALRWVAPPTAGIIVQRQWEDPSEAIHSFQWTPLRDISPEMLRAVIAAEDQRFFMHWGFDFDQLQKALMESSAGGRLRGASTITQQTAKNLFLWNGRSYTRKALEAWFTLLMEVLWSKERILEVYLNIVEFGPRVYGVAAASQAHFRKPASQLTPEEAALLAAVLPNPHRMQASAPSPYVQERQAWILEHMALLRGRF
ncbi:monofunctional biosynthetic peptidoglycan transglycosylase [Gilvimarinus sp. F26214L]|uniref:monofunctional biosynthetic peptidoglycan transglycosylase n=1 Tax=Gilvimarinus sp. DZF01 TaxID=3461371 RepID=UPI004045DF2B